MNAALIAIAAAAVLFSVLHAFILRATKAEHQRIWAKYSEEQSLRALSNEDRHRLALARIKAEKERDIALARVSEALKVLGASNGTTVSKRKVEEALALVPKREKAVA